MNDDEDADRVASAMRECRDMYIRDATQRFMAAGMTESAARAKAEWHDRNAAQAIWDMKR